MARRRWYRRYPRVVPAKKKWASNIRSGEMVAEAPGVVLGENSAQSSNPTPTIVKVGNYKVQGDISASISVGSAHVSGTLFLTFVPEGVLASTFTNTDVIQLVSRHPEYIMAWTGLDLAPVTAGGITSGTKFSLSSRLKRNLNSGDRVMLLLYNSTSSIPITVNYTATYFTCSN